MAELAEPSRSGTKWRGGRLLHIHNAPAASFEMEEVAEANFVAERGIEGDRYFLGTGTYSAKPDFRKPKVARKSRQTAMSTMAGKLRRLALGSRHRFARLAAPREHLLRRQPMPARNVGNHGARSKRLLNDPRLEIIREMAPPARPANHFQPANFRHLRLKLMVKRRHRPISQQRSHNRKSPAGITGGSQQSLRTDIGSTRISGADRVRTGKASLRTEAHILGKICEWHAI
jgi:hypothetical protein